MRFASTSDRSIVPPITIVENPEGEISAVVGEEKIFFLKVLNRLRLTLMWW